MPAPILFIAAAVTIDFVMFHFHITAAIRLLFSSPLFSLLAYFAFIRHADVIFFIAADVVIYHFMDDYDYRRGPASAIFASLMFRVYLRRHSRRYAARLLRH